MNPHPTDRVLLPVKNPAVTVFRAMLWLLPSGFTVFSAVLVQFASNGSRFTILLIWLILNAAFIIGTGWFYSWLAVDARLKPGGVRARTLKFSLFQLLVIPGILIASILAFTTVDPIQLGC